MNSPLLIHSEISFLLCYYLQCNKLYECCFSIYIIRSLEHIKMKILSLSNFFLCTAILSIHILHLISVWNTIPDTIFLMYSGETPSQTGPKELLFLVPALALLLWLVILFLNSKKEKFNYINLTEKNKKIQYKAMDRMLVSIQILSFIGFISINESFLRDTLGLNSAFYITAGLVFAILCAVPPIIWTIWSRTALNKY